MKFVGNKKYANKNKAFVNRVGLLATFKSRQSLIARKRKKIKRDYFILLVCVY